MKLCANCSGGMTGKRSNAVYCTRKCKMTAAEARRPARDNAVRYLAERDHRLVAAREYARANPQVAHLRRLRRRKLTNQQFIVTAKDWRRLVARHQECCFYCGRKEKLTADHIIPLSRGGRHSIGNLIPACLSCNSSKHCRTIMEWRLKRAVSRRERGGGGSAAAPRRPSVGSEHGRLLASA